MLTLKNIALNAYMKRHFQVWFKENDKECKKVITCFFFTFVAYLILLSNPSVLCVLVAVFFPEIFGNDFLQLSVSA